MTEIQRIEAREVLDSRGTPTVEAVVVCKNGLHAWAVVPSGASTGSREAIELRDGDSNRYFGKGVLQAVSHVNQIIAPALVGWDSLNQQGIDDRLLALDGTDNKSKLGANALLSVSLAVAKVAALCQQKPLYRHLGPGTTLPVPLMNVLNGGAHADNSIDFQEFMIVPNGASSFADALRMGAEVFHSLKTLLTQENFITAVGDEGGFAPNLKNNRTGIDFLMKAIDKAGYEPGKDISIALDVAASEFFKNDRYHLKGEERTLSAPELIDYYVEICSSYPICSIEDPLDESDWEHWGTLTQRLGQDVQIVGDDLFVTNPAYLRRGVQEKSANAILIKPNQIGTLSETLTTINMAQQHAFGCIISHRSGESEDTFIADLAVGTTSGQIKTGSLSRGERTAKYNQLLRIESALGSSAHYLGNAAFSRVAV
ncbi:MAG: phosphopyruvate hydratase [bacterium]